MPSLPLKTHSAQETERAGETLAHELSGGELILLTGDLGSGKTTFVRGIAGGLRIDETEVSSPSYTLVNQYEGGRLRLVHVDLYRLGDESEVDELALEDLLDEGSVMAVEWGERMPRHFGKVIHLHFSYQDGTVTIS